jgi:amino acid adenylation domain-containing protein
LGLHDVLDEPVRLRRDDPAVVEGSGAGQITYGQLGGISDRVRDRLAAFGVASGDRVGVYMHKSADAVAAIFGILKTGGAYVPADPSAPASRAAYIHHDCAVRAVLVERPLLPAYQEEFERLGPLPKLIVLDDVGGARHLEEALDRLDEHSRAPGVETARVDPGDLAYILYTSGSTGAPKRVMLSHRNARAFVDWCSETFEPRSSDRFSSHAPFHFDLSILDVYVPLKHGASLVLIPEGVAKEPQGLARLISEYGISVWYSAPSTLSLLAQFGKLSENDLSSLRMVLFAGEVFPVVHLRSFRAQVPAPCYFNLYGPTETNVCTWFRIPAEIPPDRVEPFPIGETCAQLESLVVDPDGRPVDRGAEGELCIAGPNVMLGYWGRSDGSAASFLARDDDGRWYKTGDIVIEDADGTYRYVGRRDRMVKRRGYRIELGEIETCLYRHPDISEAAVVAIPDEMAGVRIKAHLSVRDEHRPSLIELKTFCSAHLPLYMVPDTFTVHEALPKTSTDKLDYALLTRQG